jgi:hypothetical protein
VQSAQNLSKHIYDLNFEGFREGLELMLQQERPNLVLMAAAQVHSDLPLAALEHDLVKDC